MRIGFAASKGSCAPESPGVNSESRVSQRSIGMGRAALVAFGLVAVFTAWSGWHFLHGPAQSEARDKPDSASAADGAPAGIKAIRNVVLISIDTCRADRLSCYGYKRQTTPNIDALARDGAMFEMALTPVPITTPAHSSMFTGMYPPTHGVHFNSYDHLAPLSPDGQTGNVTLAKALREAGYQTAAFIGAFPLDVRFGLNQGFDTYDGRFAEEYSKEFFSHRTAEEVNRPAMAWLDGHTQNNARKPFFLFLHYYDCHRPYAAHPPFTTANADDPYAAEIAYVDHCIGQVMDRLRTLGAYDDTLVIVTADHGESLGEHGEVTHGYFMYQSTLHVPLVIRAPGGKKGIQVKENVSLVDIMPTVLDLVGLKTPPRVEGVDLRPALQGGPAADTERAVYAESPMPAAYCSALHGIVAGPWKYILAPRPELYDLSKDPGEMTNLADKEPQVARRLRSRLEAMFEELQRAAPHQGPSAVDPQAIKRLQSLGYVSGAAPVSALDTTREDPKDFLPTYNRLVEAWSRIDESVGRNEVKKDLLELAARRPELVEPYQLLAAIAMREGQLAHAAGYYAKAVAMLDGLKRSLTRRPGALGDLAKTHVDLAIVLQQMGNLPEAIEHCEQALRIDPEYADAHFDLGNILQQSGKLPEAIGHFEQALRIDPDYADAHLNLGNALAQAGKLPEAAGHFEQALRIRPDDAVIHYNLAAALDLKGNTAQAAAHYAEAIRMQADFLAALTRLAWIRATSKDARLRNGPEAVRLAQRACAGGQRDVDARDMLAAAYAEAGRFSEAELTARQALDLATQQKKLDLAEAIQGRIRLYESGKPFHELP